MAGFINKKNIHAMARDILCSAAADTPMGGVTLFLYDPVYDLKGDILEIFRGDKHYLQPFPYSLWWSPRMAADIIGMSRKDFNEETLRSYLESFSIDSDEYMMNLSEEKKYEFMISMLLSVRDDWTLVMTEDSDRESTETFKKIFDKYLMLKSEDMASEKVFAALQYEENDSKRKKFFSCDTFADMADKVVYLFADKDGHPDTFRISRDEVKKYTVYRAGFHEQSYVQESREVECTAPLKEALNFCGNVKGAAVDFSEIVKSDTEISSGATGRNTEVTEYIAVVNGDLPLNLSNRPALLHEIIDSRDTFAKLRSEKSKKWLSRF